MFLTPANQRTTSASSSSEIQVSKDLSRGATADQRDLSDAHTKSRQLSPALSTTSTLSDLSELSDLPSSQGGEEEVSEPAVPGHRPMSQSTSIDLDAIDGPATDKVRKRAQESDSDYAGPSKAKRARLHVKLATKSGKINRGISQETVSKVVTPTDSELSTLSHKDKDQHEDAQRPEEPRDTTQDDDDLTDDAEPDEDEERDERLASLRGTNGTTAIGRWLDPYPDGTLGEFVSHGANDTVTNPTPYDFQYGPKASRKLRSCVIDMC